MEPPGKSGRFRPTAKDDCNALPVRAVEGTYFRISGGSANEKTDGCVYSFANKKDLDDAVRLAYTTTGQPFQSYLPAEKDNIIVLVSFYLVDRKKEFESDLADLDK